MRKEVEERAREAIREKVFPGCVIGIVRANGEREIYPFGSLIYGTVGKEVKEDTVYDVASITKSIPTASLALTFISEGKLRLDDSVKQYLPELRKDYNATIEDLLRYRVHGTQLSRLPYKTFEEVRTHALEHGFNGPPGEGVYTNLPAFFLGMVLERVGNASPAVLGHRYFFEPLHMERTTFFPSPSDCAPTEVDSRGEVCGLPHDESAYLFAKKRRAVGHAGLFSTAPNLLNFLEALLAGQLPVVLEGAKKGLGWQTEGIFLGINPEGRFGKTGFTGTSLFCDIERGIGFVILSNRTYPKRSPTQDAIHVFRRDIADSILQNV